MCALPSTPGSMRSRRRAVAPTAVRAATTGVGPRTSAAPPLGLTVSRISTAVRTAGAVAGSTTPAGPVPPWVSTAGHRPGPARSSMTTAAFGTPSASAMPVARPTSAACPKGRAANRTVTVASPMPAIRPPRRASSTLVGAVSPPRAGWQRAGRLTPMPRAAGNAPNGAGRARPRTIGARGGSQSQRYAAAGATLRADEPYFFRRR